MMPKAALSNYAGREQAFVKHFLLEKYLAPLAYKVGSAWDSIVYVDGFAGPWGVTDANFADSSFAIAIETLESAQAGLRDKLRDIHMEAILVEKEKDAFEKLKSYADANTTPSFPIEALKGDFIDKLSDIDNLIKQRCRNPFRFVFLDPKGWADIPMNKLQPFLQHRSCEVLINLMTSFIVRFLTTDDRSESYNSLFGRPAVLERLRQIPKGTSEQAEQAVREYCRSLRDLCKFKYVSSAVILEPNEESIRYFLVYGTNDSKGLEVFKNAESKAAKIQNEVRHQSRNPKDEEELSLDLGDQPQSRIVFKLRDRYLERARKRVLQLLKGGSKSVRYQDLYCAAMSFPLVVQDDLRNWIDTWKPSIQVRLAGVTRRRKPSPDEDDQILVLKADHLR